MAEDKTAIATIEQDQTTATQLYGDGRSNAAMVQSITTIAPWAEGLKTEEILLVVSRSMAMGVDPLNPHEVQIWKDNRGKVNFQLAYTLTSEWVHTFQGGHTEPQYRELTEEEKKEHGLQPLDHAVEVSFVMDEDIAKLEALVVAFGKEEARKKVTVIGLGVAMKAEWNGQYFAPAARSRLWKVQKRALTDAYRRKFGTPTRAEIYQMRRASGVEMHKLSDWEGTEGLDQGDAEALAENNAKWREHNKALETDAAYAEENQKKVELGGSLLYDVNPLPEPTTIDATAVEDVTETEEKTEPTPEEDAKEKEALIAAGQRKTPGGLLYDELTAGQLTTVIETLSKKKAAGTITKRELVDLSSACLVRDHRAA